MLGKFYNKTKTLHLHRVGDAWTTCNLDLDNQMGLTSCKPKILLTTEVQREFVGSVALFSIIGFYITELVQTNEGYLFALTNGNREIFAISGDKDLTRSYTMNLIVDEAALAMSNAQDEYKQLLYKTIGYSLKVCNDTMLFDAAKNVALDIAQLSDDTNKAAVKNLEMGYICLDDAISVILNEQKNKIKNADTTLASNNIYNMAMLESEKACCKLCAPSAKGKNENFKTLKEVVKDIYDYFEMPLSKDILSLTTQTISLNQTKHALKLLKSFNSEHCQETYAELEDITLSLSPKVKKEVESIL